MTAAALLQRAAPATGPVPAAPARRLPFLQRACACGGSAGASGKCSGCETQEKLGASLLQPKLTVSAPDDPYEKEADAVAERVMRMPGPASRPMPIRRLIQRQPEEPDEELVSAKLGGPVQRDPMGPEDEDEPVAQRKAAGGAGPSPPATFAAALGASPGGTALPAAARSFFEPRFQRDLGHVRIHDGPSAAAMARDINARAFTAGADIYFAPGQYDPHSSAGRRLLAHELTHVFQQGGRQMIRRQGGQRCTGVTLELPGTIVFEGTAGPLRADLRTNMPATGGPYTISYDRASDQFVIAPWPTHDVIVEVSLSQRTAAEIETYRQYRDSLAGHPAPLTVGGGGGGETATAQDAAQPVVHFSVRDIAPDELRSQYGVDPAQIPEGVIVPLARAAEAAVGPALLFGPQFVPTPMGMVPANSTGFLWTQGHLSLFATPGGSPTIIGYRGNLGWYVGETLFTTIGFTRGRDYFTERLLRGVPGSMRNDAAFPLMGGQQAAIYVRRTPAEAEAFALRLTQTEHGGEYRYSPPRSDAPAGSGEARMFERLRANPPEGVLCTNNCITVPHSEIEAAIGGRPSLRLPDGSEIDLSTGRTSSGGVDAQRMGRARDMSTYTQEGTLPPGAQRITYTPRAAGAVGVIRVGGSLMLIYGVYQTTSRLTEAYDTPHFRRAAGEEIGAWSFGLVGSAIGAGAATATAAALTTATGAAVICAPGGPIDLACVAVGFAGGLVGGFIFGTAGALIGGEIAERTQ
ncbi:MAG TPA: DUF4157 domain-containing protein [Allosphingosinicella sp.]|nr:DUF4157 domain-containing protein [Allosphingosinicella sp.]